MANKKLPPQGSVVEACKRGLWLLKCSVHRGNNGFAVGTDGDFHDVGVHRHLNFFAVDDNFGLNLHRGLASGGGGGGGLGIQGRGGQNRGVRFGRLAIRGYGGAALLLRRAGAGLGSRAAIAGLCAERLGGIHSRLYRRCRGAAGGLARCGGALAHRLAVAVRAGRHGAYNRHCIGANDFDMLRVNHLDVFGASIRSLLCRGGGLCFVNRGLQQGQYAVVDEGLCYIGR